jgi:hypothetical protein
MEGLAPKGCFLLAGAMLGVVFGAPLPASATAEEVTLFGNGLATARFGQAEAVAISGLDRSLGRPKSATTTDEAGNCTIDAAMQWKMLTAYFYHGRFVGYSTLSATGKALAQSGVATAEGLHVGDTLAKARRIYGTALQTSYAQGGSWSAKTATGTLDGYLTAEVGQESPPPRILSIEAGAVGCPAASP